jgi:hypothetical protein
MYKNYLMHAMVNRHARWPQCDGAQLFGAQLFGAQLFGEHAQRCSTFLLGRLLRARRAQGGGGVSYSTTLLSIIINQQ